MIRPYRCRSYPYLYTKDQSANFPWELEETTGQETQGQETQGQTGRSPVVPKLQTKEWAADPPPPT